ncbi:MAG: hypothetical protein WDO14_24200 [Bacteroidota bacterium]
MEAIVANGLSWLTKHVPELALVIFLVSGVVGVTLMISNFVHSVAQIRNDLNDINTRQLPEVRFEIKEMKTEMNRRFDAVDERFSEMNKHFDEIDKRFLKIELQLNTIITHVETKEGKTPKFP